MGCTQSKTNEQDVVDPNVAQVEVLAPVVEQQVDENVSTDTTESENQTPATETVEAEAEPTPVMENSTVEVKTRDFALRFVPGEVSINEYGVAFYNFDGSNPADPSVEVHVCKRYSEFKDMHAAISKLMASEKNVKPGDQDKFQTYPALPRMPRADAVTYLLGRGNQHVVKEREQQFVKILNAVASHPIAFQSKTFSDFMT
ncbi:hypothetical protein P3T76_014650 [Phytophthora citrophthora]|uniref:PX domain-containing protein n=1 Tax=Phytophthora citrophthora TaxID=4793 RepID=A0AAD9G0K6_9STRA|nr:hypothetical protein P3T76_014650 [Phytophthora citrophthora]